MLSSVLLPLEYEQVADREIENAREAHRQQVAQDHVPSCESFYQKQHPEPDKEDSGTGQVVPRIQLEESFNGTTRPFTGPVLPDIEIGDGVVHRDGALEGNDWRDDIFTPIAFGEDQIGKKPEYNRVDYASDHPCTHELHISCQDLPHLSVFFRHRVHLCVILYVLAYRSEMHKYQNQDNHHSNVVQSLESELVATYHKAM